MAAVSARIGIGSVSLHFREEQGKLTGLTEAQKKALRLADNKIALNAGWDVEILKLELADLTGNRLAASKTANILRQLPTPK